MSPLLPPFFIYFFFLPDLKVIYPSIFPLSAEESVRLCVYDISWLAEHQSKVVKTGFHLFSENKAKIQYLLLVHRVMWLTLRKKKMCVVTEESRTWQWKLINKRTRSISHKCSRLYMLDKMNDLAEESNLLSFQVFCSLKLCSQSTFATYNWPQPYLCFSTDCIANGLHLYSAFLAPLRYPKVLYLGLSFTRTVIHQWVAAASPFGSNLGQSVLPKDTTKRLDGAGFELPTVWSLDNPLCLWSHSHMYTAFSVP